MPALVCLACVPVTPTPAPPPARVSFDHTPAAPCATPASLRVTLAVVSPQWKDATPSSMTVPVYSSTAYPAQGSTTQRMREEFSSALRTDFFELLTCRGFLTKGPFDSFDQMVYPDREGSNLLLEPELEMRVVADQIEAVPVQSALRRTIVNTGAGYKLKGSATLSGRVTLVLKEPLSNTRMWTRSIEVPAVTAEFVSDQAYHVTTAHTQESLRLAAVHDVGVMRALGPKLEQTYGAILTTADKYLNARELVVVSSQAAEVRKKAVIAVPR